MGIGFYCYSPLHGSLLLYMSFQSDVVVVCRCDVHSNLSILFIDNLLCNAEFFKV